MSINIANAALLDDSQLFLGAMILLGIVLFGAIYFFRYLHKRILFCNEILDILSINGKEVYGEFDDQNYSGNAGISGK